MAIRTIFPYSPTGHLHVVDPVSLDDGAVRAAMKENSGSIGAAIPHLVVLDAHVVAPL